MDRLAKQLLGIAVLAGVVGGILAFALDNEDASAAGLKLQSLGLVLLALTLVLAAGAAISTVGPGPGGDEKVNVESTRAIAGLVAVVAGIVAVSAIALVTASLLNSADSKSTVAITTAALGIISTFVTAYLGIKATANTSDKATKAAADLVDKLTDSGAGPTDGKERQPDPALGGGAK